MNKYVVYLIVVYGLYLFGACYDARSTDLDFLAGTWKVVDKEQYEVWEKVADKQFDGYAFQIKSGEKKITETLTIRSRSRQIVYEATVPDQNEGATIPFVLNKEIKDQLSFENLEHDFPQKIRYKPLSTDSLEVTVQGDEGKGFSYIQTRVKMD